MEGRDAVAIERKGLTDQGILTDRVVRKLRGDEIHRIQDDVEVYGIDVIEEATHHLR